MLKDGVFKGALSAARSSGKRSLYGRFVLAIVLVAIALGLWAGYEWRKGREAIADNAQLHAQAVADRQTIDDLNTAAQRLRQSAADGAAAYDAAARRMDAIAAQLEKALERNDAFTAQQRIELGVLLDRHPDLHAVDLGADVLRHWNRSNAGPRPAAPAAPGPAGQPAHAVPGPAPGAQQPGAGSDRQSRRGDRALPRVPGAQRLAPAGDRRMGAHGVAVVLPRGGGQRARFSGLSRW